MTGAYPLTHLAPLALCAAVLAGCGSKVAARVEILQLDVPVTF